MTARPGPPDLLVVAAAEATMAGLISALATHGLTSDVVRALDEARRTFLERGGHRGLVLAPDLLPATAHRILESLTGIDPDLAVLSFANHHHRPTPSHVRRIPYHPTSRAAVGAVLKALRTTNR